MSQLQVPKYASAGPLFFKTDKTHILKQFQMGSEIVNTELLHFQTSTTRYNVKLYYLLSFKLRFDYDRWRFGPYCL